MGKHRALPSECSRLQLAYPSPRPLYISVVAYSSSHSLDPRRGIVVGRTATIVCGPETRAPLSEEQIRVCGPTLPPVEHVRDASSAASSLRRSDVHRVDFIKRSLDTLCLSLQCRRKDAPYHRLYTSRSLAATNGSSKFQMFARQANDTTERPKRAASPSIC
jgi:hypothetical protein